MSGIMSGKRGLIMGVANDHSIAWGIANKLSEHGAEMAFTYQGDALGKRVRPLAESVGSSMVLPCDVEDGASIGSVFDAIGNEWGSLDFIVHSIGYTDRSQLKGRYVDVTTRENFIKTMVISAYSFTEVAQHATPLLNPKSSLLTLTYGGSQRIMPNYNVMGVAKAALEASVRYMANDFGPDDIRVNALSAGPVRTLAGSGVADARAMYNFQQRNSPLRRPVSLEQIGGSALYLLSDLSAGVTGETHYVDSGYHIVSMPCTSELQRSDEK